MLKIRNVNCFCVTYRVLFLTVPTQKFLSIRKKQSIRTVPTQKFLSTRKKQSIRTVPTQKCLSVEKVKALEQTKRDTEFSAAIGMLYYFCADIVASPLVFIFHYSFILFLHMRDLSPEKCELVDI